MTHDLLPLRIAIAVIGPVVTLRCLTSIVMRVNDLLCAAAHVHRKSFELPAARPLGEALDA